MPSRPPHTVAGRGARWDVAVVVPARDEAELLPRCLASVARAAARVAPPSRVHVVVVADRCSDATEAVAAAALARADGSIVRTRGASVGQTRQRGVDAALQVWPTGAARRIWIAMTDADSVVPRHWLTYQLAAAAQGWEAVAGAVAVGDWSARPAGTASALAAYRRAQRRAATWPVHGANLGVDADALAAVGGIPAVAHSEDSGLIEVLEDAGRRVLRSRELTVTTSARVSWRAPGGFSTLLDRIGVS